MLVATWNVNSISVRLDQVIDWIRQTEPDVLCLQETKTVDEKFPRENFEQLGYQCQFYGEKSYNGVAIISKQKPSDVRRGFTDEVNGTKRLIEARFDDVIVLNTYVPNGQAVGSEKFVYKLSWLASLKRHMESYSANQDVIWCGDFNIAPEDIDVYDSTIWKGEIMCSEPERNMLQTIKDRGFADVFRLHDPAGGKYSWWDYRAGAFRRNMGLRIDHIWMSKTLAQRCLRCWIDMEPRKLERASDHAPVLALLQKE